MVIAKLTDLIAENTGNVAEDIDIWEFFRLFLYHEYAFECDKSSQTNIIYKFIHISIKSMIKNY